MALLSPGPIGTISGSIGSITCSQSKTGQTIRSRRCLNIAPSTAQREEQLRLATLTTIWSSSTMDTTREAWNIYARNHPVPNRFGVPRLVSGYCAWLRFLPLHWLFFKVSSYYLAPPVNVRSFYMTTISAAITSAPSLVIVAPGFYHVFWTYEQVQVARWQSPTGKIARPIWQNAVPLTLKSYDTTDYTSYLIPGLVPVPGETWAIRVRWFTTYLDSSRHLYTCDREPLPWSYCQATAT